MVKSKLKKIILTIALIYGSLFPKSGVIIHERTVEEMEDMGEIHIGI